MKHWYKITAKADSDSVEVLIYDLIGDFGWSSISAQGLIRDLKQYSGKRIDVRINSVGGAVYDAIAIYNYLKGRGNVHTYVDGIAASAATIVMLAGEKVTIAKNGFVMIHDLSADPGYSTPDELEKAAEVARKVNDGLIATYVDETGNDEKTVRKWMAEETWFSADEAKEFGFADEVSGETANLAAVAVHAQLSRFRRVPSALGGQPAPEPPKKDNTMNKLLAALVAAGLLPHTKLEDEEASELFKAQWKKHQDDRDANLKKITSLESTITQNRQSQAESYVNAAVKAGKIKDDAGLRARWVKAYLADEEGTRAMIDGMEAKAPAKTGAPPVPTDGGDDKPDESKLRAQLATESNPEKRALIARQLRELRGHKDLFV